MGKSHLFLISCLLFFTACNSGFENLEDFPTQDLALGPSGGLNLSAGNGFGSEGEFGAPAYHRAFSQREICNIQYVEVPTSETLIGTEGEERREIRFIPETLYAPSSLNRNGETYNNYAMTNENCGDEGAVEAQVDPQTIKELPLTKIYDDRLILSAGLLSYKGRFFVGEGTQAPDLICFGQSQEQTNIIVEIYDSTRATLTLTFPTERDFTYLRYVGLPVTHDIEGAFYRFASEDQNFSLSFEKHSEEESLLSNTYMDGSLHLNYFDDSDEIQSLEGAELSCLADIQQVFGVENWY